MKKTRKKTAKINSNINLALSETNQNYWSLLTYLVNEQEEMMEETTKPITAARRESEREKRVLLKMNKKKHWSEIWKKDGDRVWNRTHDPNDVIAKPNNKPKTTVQTGFFGKHGSNP